MVNSFAKTVGYRIAVSAIALSCMHCTALRCEDSQAVEYMWQRQPRLNFSWLYTEPEPTFHVTAESLRSPKASARLQAAQTILQLSEDANEKHPELLPALIALLESGEPQPVVRAAAVAAACKLDDGQHAKLLWRAASAQPRSQATVEQACIRWRSPLLREHWRSQLQAQGTGEQEVIRALNGLATAGSEDDVTQLASVVTDATRPTAVRLTAARAIGVLSKQPQLMLARQLESSSAEHADLLAVLVIAKELTPENKTYIAGVLDRSTPLAQRHAYEWLCDVDPDTARANAVKFAHHTDAHVRRLSLLQVAQIDGEEAIGTLVRALKDKHPGIRDLAREQLQERWSQNKEDKRFVEDAIAKGLESTDWRSMQQVLRLAVDLNLPVHVPRMLELLEHSQAEVSITAAWALRHLAAEETALDAMLKHAQGLTTKLSTETPEEGSYAEADLRRVAHLLEAFGARQYAPAKETLLLYVPKNGQRMGLITRMAGIWACGKMWEGEENRKLNDELCARAADNMGMYSEPDSIRFVAILALGWIGDPSSRETIETYGLPKDSPLGHAGTWALEQLDKR